MNPVEQMEEKEQKQTGAQSALRTPVYVMSHTHWDRAWYLPFEKFRRVLVRVFDTLIEHFEDPDYRQFIFDGQTVVLEDYLAIRPQRRADLERLVRGKRLRVGPFYMLPDEFLAGQEALVRNMLVGRKISEAFGERMPVGYVADPFGHPEQMPQLLRGMGLDSLVFARGVGPEIDPARSEFIWEAPDGSQVYAVWQHNWYCSGSYLGFPEIQGPDDRSIFRFEEGVDQLINQAEDYTNKTCVGAIVIYNGVDHEVPKKDVVEIIRAANERQDKFEFIHSDMVPFLEHVRQNHGKLQHFRGKLRSGTHTGLLGGTLATRMYLKQNQEQVETLLSLQAEPMAAMAMAVAGYEYPVDFLGYAWKEHLKNLPHDDICGCSTDETHMDAETRSRNARQVAEDILSEAARAIAEKVDGSAQPGRPFIVLNTLPFERSIDVDFLDFRAGAWDGRGRLKIVDEQGNPISCDLKEVTFEHLLVHQGEPLMRRAHVQLSVPAVPGMGWRVIYAQHVEEAAKSESLVKVEGSSIETPLLSIKLNADGSLDLTDKETGRSLPGINALRDVADHGDEYNFDALPGDPMIAPKPLEPWRCTAQSSQGAQLECVVTMPTPLSLTADRSARMQQTRDIPLAITMKVSAQSKRLDFEVSLINTCKDHKLMALFPTGLTGKNICVDSTFGLFEEEVEILGGEAVAGWHEKPLAQRPVKRFVAMGDEQGGCAVFNKGLPEFEAMRGEDGTVTIAQTLMRAVGWLSRGDLFIRDQNGGPEVVAPQGQCLREFTFRYAFTPWSGEAGRDGLYQAASEFAVPGTCIPLLDRERDPNPENVHFQGRFIPRPAKGELPGLCSLMTVLTPGLSVSTVKKAEDERAVVVRLYNPHPGEKTAQLKFDKTPTSLRWMQIDERTLESEVPVKGGMAAFTMPAYKIATLLLTY